MRSVSPRFISGAFLLLLGVLAATGPARGLAPRTFIASSGNDTNACTRTDPCRTFNAALAATVAGGDVIPLDSSGYGVVTINKSISFIAPDGLYAGIVATTGVAVNVSTVASDRVSMRGVRINGGNTATTGIQMTSPGTLIVENSVIEGFQANGVDVTGVDRVVLQDTTIRGCGTGVHFGGGGSNPVNYLRADLLHCQIESNVNDGVFVDYSIDANLLDSQVVNNGRYGVWAKGEPAGDLTASPGVHLRNAFIAHNLTDVRSENKAFVYIAHSLVSDASSSGFGLQAISFGRIFSQGNNDFNTISSSGTIESYNQQ